MQARFGLGVDDPKQRFFAGGLTAIMAGLKHNPQAGK